MADGLVGGEHGRLRRAVGVHDLPAEAGGQQRAHRVRTAGLATEVQRPERCAGQVPGVRAVVDECAGHRQHVDPRVGEGPSQRLRRHDHVAVEDVHAAAVEQGSPDLEGGVVRAGVGRLRDPVAGFDAHVVGVDHQTDDTAVGDRHALGDAGRPGGGHDVGEGVRVPAVSERAGLPVPGGRLLDAQDAEAPRPVAARGSGVRHHAPRTRLPQHLAEPGVRVVGVQRHVGAAGLEDAEVGDDEVHRARQAHPDGVLAADAVPAQVPRDGVGTPVEVAVADLPRAVDDGDRVGAAPGLRGEAGVHGPARGGAGRKGGRGLGQRQPAGGEIGVAGGVGQETGELVGHRGHGPGVEQRAVVDPVQDGRIGARVDGERQVAQREPPLVRHRDGRQVAQREGTLLRIPDVQAHLLVGDGADALVGPQGAQQQLVRGVLVAHHTEDGGLRPREQLAEGGVAAQVQGHRERPGEHPDQALDLGTEALARDRKTDAQVLLPGVPVQEDAERGQGRHHQRGALRAGQRRQFAGHRRRQRDLVHASSALAVAVAPAVRRQVQHGRAVGEPAAPVGDLPLHLRQVLAGALPGGVVGRPERRRRLGGLPGVAAAGLGAVQGAEVGEQDGPGQQVDDHVVGHQQQGPPVLAGAQDDDPEQRAPRQVEAAGRSGVDMARGGAGGVRVAPQIDLLRCQHPVGAHPLARNAPHHVDHRAQRHMAFAQPGRGPGQGSGVEVAAQREAPHAGVGGELREHPLGQPDALLRVGKRTLSAGAAAGARDALHAHRGSSGRPAAAPAGCRRGSTGAASPRKAVARSQARAATTGWWRSAAKRLAKACPAPA